MFVAQPSIYALFTSQARELVPEYDKFGMIIPESLDRNDPWQHRLAQAQAFCLLAPSWEQDDILPLFDFLVAQKALGDRNEDIRTRMLAVSYLPTSKSLWTCALLTPPISHLTGR
jgi:hypothetical protein